MNINCGTIHGVVYCNVTTIPMKNATIASNFEKYVPFFLLIILSCSWSLLFWFYWILSSSLDDMYCWLKLDLELELNLHCMTYGWSYKENYESISPASSCTCNNDLFDDDTHLQVYIQCRIGYCCTMYHEASSPLWRHRFWKCDHSMRSACTVRIPNCNHCT